MIGLNRAREQGKKLGRKTKINESLITAVKLLREKDVSIKNISKELKIGVGTVYKICEVQKSLVFWRQIKHQKIIKFDTLEDVKFLMISELIEKVHFHSN